VRAAASAEGLTGGSYIVLGGTGLIGSALCAHLRQEGRSVVSVTSANYDVHRGAAADVIVNCNGNSYRYRANRDPRWDFTASVTSVEQSLFDFGFDLYVYISTVDVYDHRDDPGCNHEAVAIDPTGLDAYGFHKWLAERLVERFARKSLILRVGTAVGPGLKKGPIYDILAGNPLRMSLDSELTLIDTPTVARAVTTLAVSAPSREIFNVTGTGPVRLQDLEARVPGRITVAPEAEATRYRYHINNERIRSVLPVPTSREVAEGFLSGAGEHACAS